MGKVEARDIQLKKTMWLTLIVAALVIIVDQAGKAVVAANLPVGGAWSPFPGPNPFFQIVYTYNTGVAFGLFKDLGVVFIIVPLIISGVILYYARRVQPDQKLIAFALGLMLGGALGNVIDRIRLGGGVLDFFEVGIGSFRNASNFADWSIVAGVILWAAAMFLDERKQKPQPTAASAADEVDSSK
jgi:signal peptidase II